MMAIATLTGDFATVTVGQYTIMNNVWGAGGLVNGVDYTQTITYDTTNLTNGLTMAWDWPTYEVQRVFSYPAIKAGWAPWDMAGNQMMLAKAADLKNLTLTFDTTLSGATGDFNVAINVWLTSVPFGGGEAITTELLITLHESTPINWPDLPQYVDPVSGYTARYFFDDNQHSETQVIRFVGVATEADFLSGTFDLGALITTLQQQGIIGADEYVSGFEFGSEVKGGGAGQTVINGFSHQFAAYAVTEGADVLTGLARGDAIRGGGGNDTISGLDGHDTLRGEAGDDSLNGGNGNDRLDGGAGNDTLIGAAGNDSMAGGEGMDSLNGGVGDDSLVGGAEADTLIGAAGNDVLMGGDGADSLRGDAGNDSLSGDAGDDRMSGGIGHDVLAGGSGTDVMTGGAGADVFVFGPGGAGAQADRITDFVTGADRIDLTGFRDAGGDGLMFLGAGAFVANGEGQVRLVMLGRNAQVQVDSDGDGVADLTIALTRVGLPSVTDLLL